MKQNVIERVCVYMCVCVLVSLGGLGGGGYNCI